MRPFPIIIFAALCFGPQAWGIEPTFDEEAPADAGGVSKESTTPDSQGPKPIQKDEQIPVAIDENQSAMEQVRDVRREESRQLPRSQRMSFRNPVLRPWAFTMYEKAHETDFTFSQFTTSGYYDDTGSFTALEEGQSYIKRDSSITLRYGMSDQLEVRGGGRYRQNISETATTSKATKTGLESLLIGLRYRMPPSSPGSKWIFTANLEYRKAMFSNQEYAQGQTVPTDEIILGDDGAATLGELQMSYRRTPGHVLNFSAGLQAPGTGLSAEIPYGADNTWFWERFGLGFGLKGIQSLNTDKDKDDPNARPRMATGQTRLWNSVNRSWIAPNAHLRWAFQNWSVGLEYAQVIKGEFTDKGSEIKFSLTYSSQGVAPEERKLSDFKEYTIDASIIKSSPRGMFVKIDHGVAQDVEKGMRFDIYKTDYFGGNILIAEAVAYEIGNDWAILKVIKVFRNIPIEKGQAARAR